MKYNANYISGTFLTLWKVKLIFPQTTLRSINLIIFSVNTRKIEASKG